MQNSHSRTLDNNPRQQQYDLEPLETLNPALLAASITIPKPNQNKSYCQLCYKEFTLITRKYHCLYCTRSCCTNCSKEMQEGTQKARHCEYCEVKLANSQIDQFFQLGREWREIDKQMLEKKLIWYRAKQVKREHKVRHFARLVLLSSSSEK